MPRSPQGRFYQEITAKIIAELAAGRLPCVHPWGTSVAQAPLALQHGPALLRHHCSSCGTPSYSTASPATEYKGAARCFAPMAGFPRIVLMPSAAC